MKWANQDDEAHWCSLSTNLVACITPIKDGSGEWCAEILQDGCYIDLAWLGDFATEAAAKSAVAAWIGKTIAQLGNALAAGEPRVDEE